VEVVVVDRVVIGVIVFIVDVNRVGVGVIVDDVNNRVVDACGGEGG